MEKTKPITREEWKDRWTDWNIKRGAITVDPVRLEKHGIVKFKTIEMAADDPFAAMKAEIDQYQVFVDEMLADAANLSDACNELANEASEAGREILTKGVLMASRTMAFAGMAVWMGAKLYEGYKQQQINDAYNAQMKELLAEKKKVGKAKLKPVTERYKTFQRGSMAKIKNLYLAEAGRRIHATDKQISVKTDIFKRSFCMYVKARYLSDILLFVINEMTAWSEGKQDADYNPKPNLETIIAFEVDRWKKAWIEDDRPLPDYLYELITTPQESYEPAVLLIFKEPYLLKEYAGVQSMDDILHGRSLAVRTLSAPIAHLYFGKPDNSRPVEKPIQALLNKNSYYKECKQFIKKYEDHTLGSSLFGGCLIYVVTFLVGLYVGGAAAASCMMGLVAVTDGDPELGIFMMLFGAGVIGLLYWLCGKVSRYFYPIKNYWNFMKERVTEEQQLRTTLNEKYNQI